MSKIPIKREEITADWLSSMLSLCGHCVISDYEFEEITGNNSEISQLFRLWLNYQQRSEAHPDVVIVKMPPEDDITRLREASYGPYVGELGAYRLLESFHGSNIARLYGAMEDTYERTACFVLEDIGELPLGHKYAKIDFGLAKVTLSFMAKFHGKFWNENSLGSAPWIHDADWSFLFDQDPLDSLNGWQLIKNEDRFEMTEALFFAGEYLGPRLNDLKIALRTRPNTLTHNDLHQGNVMFRYEASGPVPVVIYWQLPAFAGATNDLAKFLMTAVPLEILAEREEELVKHYLLQLHDQGVSEYGFDECWRDYRRAQVATFANYVLNCSEISDQEDFIQSLGYSTYAVIKALSMVDSQELIEILP